MYFQNPLVRQIIGAAIAVHRALGAGLFESSYEACLAYELMERGLPFERQVPVPVVYKGVRLDCGYRADFLVNREIPVELKCIERWMPIHTVQMKTYLRLLGLQQGLLINFNVPVLVHGVRSVVVESLEETAPEEELELPGPSSEPS